MDAGRARGVRFGLKRVRLMRRGPGGSAARAGGGRIGAGGSFVGLVRMLRLKSVAKTFGVAA